MKAKNHLFHKKAIFSVNREIAQRPAKNGDFCRSSDPIEIPKEGLQKRFLGLARLGCGNRD